MPLLTDVLELVTLFNRQTSDLPDGLLDRNCVLRLNGRAYHEHLGRPPDDPLIRLIGCGAAGYRLVLAAVRHAMHEPRVVLHGSPIAAETPGSGAKVRARGTMSGRLRGRDGPFSAEFLLEVVADREGRIGEIAVTLGDADVELLFEARHRA